MICRLTHVGTATLILEIGSVRILTDPAFDPPGGSYHFGYGTSSRKLTAPAIQPEEIGKMDVILLSHDHHEDNLDRAGRALLPLAGKVITTSAGAKRLSGDNIVGLKSWQNTTVKSGDMEIKITAAPARHGSLGSYLIVGETTGFILAWNGQKRGALYISGDTVWFNGLCEIARRFKIGIAILHIGAAGFPITGPVRFTMNAREAVRVINTLNPHTVIPIHYEGWKHFREPKAEAEKQFAAAGLDERIRWLALGKPGDVEI